MAKTARVPAPFEASFTYWSGDQAPDPFEVMDIINGSHPKVQRHAGIVQDIRDPAQSMNLDDHALQVIEHRSALLPPFHEDFDFENAQAVRDEYWPELRSVLRSELGVRSVVFTESVTRTSNEAPHKDYRDKDGRVKVINGVRRPPTIGQPFHVVHNDFSPVGSRNALRAVRQSFFEDNGCAESVAMQDQRGFFELREEVIAAEQEAIEKSGAESHKDWDGTDYKGPRWAHFSIWRPLDVVHKDPLGLLDPACIFSRPSTYEDKLAAYHSILFPHKDRRGMDDYVGANIMPRPPKHGEQHRWFYIKEQRPDEILAIKLFDSEAWKKGSRVMPCAAHSAFELPDQTGLPPRRSIETRGFVIW